MYASLEVIQTAVRVLSALTAQQPPDAADVMILREYVGRNNGCDLNELACVAIQKAARIRILIRHRDP
jgi:hypothetical protein